MHNSCVLLLYKSHNSGLFFARTMARKQKNEFFFHNKKKPVRLLIRRPACIAVNCMQVSRRIAAVQVEIWANPSASAMIFITPD